MISIPERPWAIDAAAVLERLDSTRDGLTHDEARRRRESFGTNELEVAAGPDLLRIVLDQFTSPLIYILLIAAAITVIVGEYIDAGVIAFVLVVNAIMGFTQEYRAERSMEALRSLSRASARVVRGGREREVDAAELVPGDLLLLEAGDRVPADARLVHAVSLETDESLLTGESTAVDKRVESLPESTAPADRLNSVFMGTTITRGRARGLVVATGASTMLGGIAESVRQIGATETPLQRRMARFARVIGVVILIACAVGFAAGLYHGDELGELFLAVVALAVSAIPEGLPIVLTVVLAIGVRRMAQRNAIIRHLPAVETLGSCTVIGSDKTGTLTENRMTVQVIGVHGRRYGVSGAGYRTDGEITRAGGAPGGPAAEDRHLERLLVVGALCNNASLLELDGEAQVHGDPTEIALLVAAAKAGLTKDVLEDRYVRVAEIPFESERRFAATVHRDEDGDGGVFIAVKGAPERLLAMCETDAAGDPLDCDRLLAEAEAMASEGLRVLAMADGDVSDVGGLVADPERHVRGLRFLGLQGMIDPPRGEAIEAVRGCQRSGIRVVMITGDHATTALAIARQLGIAAEGERAVTGVELDEMGDERLDAVVDRVAVYARVSPNHKLRIVTALQRAGHVVAVTGDGVNDAPALKAADVGAAMGRSGTDVAREAADIVVTDDNFASIYAAVGEGRIAFDNVRKTTFYLISTGAAEIAAVLASLLFRFPLPFVPAQILWLNVVTNGVQDVGLAFEPGERDVLRRLPRRRGEGVISSVLWHRTLITGLVMAAGTILVFFWELGVHADLDLARTAALTTMVLFQAFHVGNSRSEHESVFRRSPLSNRFLLAGTLAALAVHVAALYLPMTQFLLRVQPLALDTWIRTAAVAASVIFAVELHKLMVAHQRRAA